MDKKSSLIAEHETLIQKNKVIVPNETAPEDNDNIKQICVVLKNLLDDYEKLACDPSTSSSTRSNLRREIADYRQLISSDEAKLDSLYESIKEIYIRIQTMVHKGLLDSNLPQKRGDIFYHLKKAIEFYTDAKGPFFFNVNRKTFFCPEIVFS
jgi:hypothetical protein